MRESHQQLDSLIGPIESSRVMSSLRRGATRRDVLALLMAGGMQATLAGGIATAALSAHASTPRRGGRLRVAGATAAANDTLDPAKQSNQTDYSRCNMIYNGLTSLDGSLTPQPSLAESFSTTDAKTWVFTLRKGITFHDGNVNPRPSADTLLTQFFQSDAAWNESRWKNPKFDQLLLAARAETDVAKRKQYYADMQTMIHHEAGIGIPMFLPSIDGHTSKLKGLTPLPLGNLMGYAFGENVWLEA